MADVKLTYFDFPGGRGEECRLALHLAEVPFEDDRIAGATWRERKPTTPFGGLPVLEVEGKGRLAQSNAILGYVGREHGLHPSDPWEAARHEALMEAVEDLRHAIQPALRASGDEREAARKEFAEGWMQQWGANVEAQLEGPFVAGDTVHVADLKLFVIQKWFVSGGVDHVPTDVFASFPKLSGVYEAVASHPRVVDWYARSTTKPQA